MITSIETITYKKNNVNTGFSLNDEKQKQMVSFIKLSDIGERCSFITDINTFLFSRQTGFKECFGTDDLNNLSEFEQLIHPTHRLSLKAFFRFIATELSEDRVRGQFMDLRFVSVYALQHANGNYNLVKSMSAPFRLNQAGKTSEIITVVDIIKDYNYEPIRMRILDKFDLSVQPVYDRLKYYIQKSAYHILPFSPAELILLKMMYQSPNLTTTELAECLYLSKTTVQTHRTRIVKKAKNHFEQPFETARQVAEYLNKGLMI